MPLELGLYLGCKIYGGRVQARKACLILDSEPYRYRASISDIAGLDIHSHSGDPVTAIIEIRNWLASVSRIQGLPGGVKIAARYTAFLRELPDRCAEFQLSHDHLTFSDLQAMVEKWLETKR